MVIDIKSIDASISQEIPLKQRRMKKMFLHLTNVLFPIDEELPFGEGCTARVKIISDKYKELVDIPIISDIVYDFNRLNNGYPRRFIEDTEGGYLVNGVVEIPFDTDEIDNSLDIYDKDAFTLDYHTGNIISGNINFTFLPTESEMRYIPKLFDSSILKNTTSIQKYLPFDNTIRLLMIPDNYDNRIVVNKNNVSIMDTNGNLALDATLAYFKEKYVPYYDLSESLYKTRSIMLDCINAKHLIKEVLSGKIEIMSYTSSVTPEGIYLLQFSMTEIAKA